MQRHNLQVRDQQLIRESGASVAYHYPEYKTYQDDLRTVLNHPTPENWLLAGKILKHMNQYHRKKFLKICPDIFADIDVFTLMVCAFIPEADTAEFAIKRVPQLRSEQEYKKLLAVIPEHDLQAFMARANEDLSYPQQADAQPASSSLYALLFASQDSQNHTQRAPAFTSLWTPVNSKQLQTKKYDHHSNCLLQ